MTAASAAERIGAALAEIERDRGVRILYACESGSRAWGFASADSDWDARFIYAHPRDWHLSIRERRDVIERPISDDLDIAGWDLRKALRLMAKGNPPLLEWLRSPIVYRADAAALAALRALAARCYSPTRAHWHYFRMAEGNHRRYLQGPSIIRKKQLYVLRPVLACRWIERRPDAPPPMEFEKLVAATLDDPALMDAIAALLAAKRRGAEMDAGPRCPIIGAFLDAEIARLADAAPATAPLPEEDWAALDAAFREMLEG